MDNIKIDFKSNLWVWDGPSPWYFVTVPEKESKIIHEKFRHLHRGWGSIPVTVQIGEALWRTSIFWEKKGTYLLPIKKEIRSKEKLIANKHINVLLSFKDII